MLTWLFSSLNKLSNHCLYFLFQKFKLWGNRVTSLVQINLFQTLVGISREFIYICKSDQKTRYIHPIKMKNYDQKLEVTFMDIFEIVHDTALWTMRWPNGHIARTTTRRTISKLFFLPLTSCYRTSI